MALRILFTCATLLCTCLATTDLSAHIGGHGKGALRTWKVGRSHLHGSFHSMRDGDVVIENSRGKLRRYPLTALSAADQAYAMQRYRRLHAMVEPSQTPQQVRPVVTPTAQPSLPTAQVAPWVVAGSTALALTALAVASMIVVGTSRRRTFEGRIAARPSLAVALALSALGSLAPSLQASMQAVLMGTDPMVIDASFAPFKPRVATRWDDTYFYVEHDGMPMDMPAMKGITAWQQQVPIPQFYVGNNAWSIPLNPVPAERPILLDTAFHTGAVAIAVNGLPIFNPENNRGEFSLDIGELDAFGGHCGRADDYHYHIAPIHLQERLGADSPIAWALDGYPLYGYREPDGSDVQPLDANLGHEWNGAYHYHAVKTRPYMMAAMRGKVTIDRDQVMPQAQTRGVRPFLQALRGAEITDLHACDSNHYALKYTVNGQTNWVNYRWLSNGQYTYVFVAPNGTRTTQTYQRK